jgi:signal transduction histidine kinase
MKRLLAILSIFIAILPLSARGQSYEAAKSKIEHLDSLLLHGAISEEAYIDSVAAWRWTQLTNGILFDAGTLVDYLQHYKRIVFSNDKYAANRIKYFDYLATNARMNVRSGEAIYFYGKLEEELEKQTGNKSLFRLSEQCSYYMLPKYYEKIIAAYENGNGYEILQSYPAKIRANVLDTITAYRFVFLTTPVSVAYANTGDAVNFEKTYAVSKAIGQELSRKLAPNSSWAYTIKFELDNMDVQRELYLKHNPALAIKLLKNQLSYLSADTVQEKNWLNILKQKVYEVLIDAYIAHEQYDSAEACIGYLQAFGTRSPETNMNIYLAESHIASAKGDYKTALEKRVKAADLKELFSFTLLDETQNILYAHAEAEYNRRELTIAEQQKRTRLNWVIGIGTVAFVILIGAFTLYRRQQSTYNQMIKRLNEITELQIAEVEREASLKEQERLGQELHDDFAATLASMIHQLNALAQGIEDAPVRHKLTEAAQNATQMYKAVRAKSHKLYEAQEQAIDGSFEQQIKKIAESALSDGEFKKEIEVDANAVAPLQAAQRIELLRIIQEAMANIVKHAKRASEVFIFIYKREETLVMEIGDNGGGMSKKSQPGIGLKSINSRIERLGGQLRLDVENGLVLKMNIPIYASSLN